MLAIAWMHVLIGLGAALLLVLAFWVAWTLLHPAAERKTEQRFRRYTRPEDRLDWSMDRARTGARSTPREPREGDGTPP